MNFKEIDSATLDFQEKSLRRDKFINAVCHGILGIAVSAGLVAMLIMEGMLWGVYQSTNAVHTAL